MEVMESIDDLSVSRNKIIINSTQKVSSRVLNSRNMMSIAHASWACRHTFFVANHVVFVSILDPPKNRLCQNLVFLHVWPLTVQIVCAAPLVPSRGIKRC